ncbi:MAG: ribose 5-phosphate isomerase B [Actinomycetota bacterium]|nr:ribose 5-phosphate isomerase B [Actinomycetota bacterium]
MRIAIGSDHAGYHLKAYLADHLARSGHDVIDVGTDSTDPVGYPTFCAEVGRKVVSGEADKGIVLGGSGQGEQISANKVNGVRAALCPDEYTARLARSHNDANVCSLGARVVAQEYAAAILDVFLDTRFEGGRHESRLAQIRDIEREECEQGRAGGR